MEPSLDLIKFTNVSKSYQGDFWKPKNKVLENMTFSISEGSITGFMGVNGAGKTTVLKILLGLTTHDEGAIEYNFADADFRKYISFLAERPYFYNSMTGKEFVLYMAKLQEINKDEVISMISEWAPTLKINHALERKLSGYSKGMLQRIGMLSCLISKPKLLILDEPFTGLDPLGKQEFKNIIKKFYQKYHTTIFFTTHSISDLFELCTSVVILKNGVTAFSGEIKDFLKIKNFQQKMILYKDGQGLVNEIKLEDEEIDKKVEAILKSGGSIIKISESYDAIEKYIYMD